MFKLHLSFKYFNKEWLLMDNLKTSFVIFIKAAQ